MKRQYWADALRTMACVMVVVIHVCGRGWYAMESSGPDWWTVNLLDSLCRCSVPLFFMLSGAMMLDRPLDARRLAVRTGRLLLLWLMASAAYALMGQAPLELLTHPVYFLQLILQSHYHLWFLRTLACIYLLLPVLRALVCHEEGRWVPWYLTVFFLFGVVRQSMGQLPVSGSTWQALRLVLVPELCQYSGYFVLGWYLSHKEPKIHRRAYIGAYLLCTAVIALGTHLWSLNGAENDERMYAYLGLPVFIQAVCLFTSARALQPGRLGKAVDKLAPLTLGIYLIHPAAISLLSALGLTVSVLPRALSVPVVAGLSLVISAACTLLLRRLPILKKLL